MIRRKSEVLQQEIHPEVRSKWGHLQCYCQKMPKIRLSKTAKNLNKVFLTCGAAATTGSRCKYFQWIHTPLYPLPSDPTPDWLQKGQAYKPRPLKSFNKESLEWLQQAEQNVDKWKREKTWLNQFAESTRKQNERWEAKKKAPVLPSTFQWSPEIAEVYKKQEQWEDINTMANNQFQASVKNAWGQIPPSGASLASYLQKRKNKGKILSPVDEKFLQACQQLRQPATGFWPQNEAAIAKFIHGPWPFGDLPEKVCSLASFCRE